MSKRKSTKHCCFVLFCGAPRALLSERSYKHPLCVFFPEENRLLLPFVRLIHRPDHLKPVHPDICAKGGLRFRSDQFIFYRPAHGFQNLFILYVSVCLLRGRFRLACHVPQHYSQLLPGLRNRKAFGQVILNVAVRQQNARRPQQPCQRPTQRSQHLRRRLQNQHRAVPGQAPDYPKSHRRRSFRHCS